MADTCSSTPGCAGTIVDGFCDVCGGQPREAVSTPASQPTGAGDGSSRSAPSSARSSRRSSSSSRRSSSRRLGLGLVEVPEVPKADPTKLVMADAKVPEHKRFCTGTKKDGSACDTALAREKCTKCGQAHEYTGTPRKACASCGGPCELVAREKGFCNVCGTPYDFRPKLEPGDLLAEQYEVAGCLAFGGMGSIYLARDVTLNRYVVLKGLVNSSDPALARAAVAERQFLAEVKHPNIVGVYTCISDAREIDGKHETHAYTVMEYVGGVTLKSLRKDRGPLPPAEVLAYMHPVLMALGYMHAAGLIYNDFKPENVMLEEGDIKVIDLGGVCRASQTGGDIYSTVGYAAPELSAEGPSATSDLYSIGRAIAVLVTEFKHFQSSYRHKLRTPIEEPIYQRYDSLHRLLQKACHEDPNLRFQHAEEMAEQLLGVLREIVALDSGTPRPAESRLFGPDPLGVRALEDERIAALDPESLPAVKMQPEDPATGFILGNLGLGDPTKQTPVLVQALSRYPESIEARLAAARHQLRLGNLEEAERHVAEVEARDAFDWRLAWYRGLIHLARPAPAAAADAFATCYRELPGELAPKLALAVAAELAGERERAVRYYDLVSRADASYATAIFGLARCLCAAGKRAEAVAALGRVAPTSILYAPAQKAIAATLIVDAGGKPGAAELAKASSTIEALMLEGVERFRLARDVFATALALLGAGDLSPAPSVTLLGQRLDDAGVRRGLEHAYRSLARLTEDAGERIALVDRANQVRPKTWT